MTCRRCGRQIAYVARLDAWGHSDRLPAGIFHYVPSPAPERAALRSDATTSDAGLDAAADRTPGDIPVSLRGRGLRRSVLAKAG